MARRVHFRDLCSRPGVRVSKSLATPNVSGACALRITHITLYAMSWLHINKDELNFLVSLELPKSADAALKT